MSKPISSNRAELAECAYDPAAGASVAAAATLADSGAIDYRRYNSGHYTVTGATTTSLTWYSSHEDVTASYVAAYSEANAAVTVTVATARRYPIPAALAGAHYIRAVANNAGTLDNVVLKAG